MDSNIEQRVKRLADMKCDIDDLRETYLCWYIDTVKYFLKSYKLYDMVVRKSDGRIGKLIATKSESDPIEFYPYNMSKGELCARCSGCINGSTLFEKFETVLEEFEPAPAECKRGRCKR